MAPTWLTLTAALIAATPPTLAALATWWNIRKETKQIHVLVNSNMSAMQEKLMSAVGEIAELKLTIASLLPPSKL